MKFIFLAIISVVCSTMSLAGEKLGKREVLLDNTDVEVVRLTYPVGAESGMHSHIHPNRVVYFVKGGVLELVPQDPTQPSNVLKVTDGETLYLPATTHNVKNIGETEIIIVETEIKRS
ncbi:cupin domain-containing protein [Paraglaciecola aestuariivivens]